MDVDDLNEKHLSRRYDKTRPDFMERMRRLNSKNTTIQNESILNSNDNDEYDIDAPIPEIRINIHKNSFLQALGIRIEDENNGCNGIFPFQIVVNSEIETAIDEVYTICDSNVGPPYVLDGGGTNSAWTWRDINNQVLSTDRFFNLEQGWFSVILEKHENGLVCSETKYFAVVKALAPIIDKITAANNEIKVSILTPGNYEFSLDNITYYGSGNSHTFNASSHK
jgi:hypothetical protein